MNQDANNNIVNRYASSPQGSVGWYEHDERTPIYVIPAQYPTSAASHENRPPPPSPLATETYSNGHPLSYNQYQHHLYMSQVPSPYNNGLVPSRHVRMYGSSPSHASNRTTTRPGNVRHSPYQQAGIFSTTTLSGSNVSSTGVKGTPQQTICRYFYKGQECKFGNKCKFRHSYPSAASYQTPVGTKTMRRTSGSTGKFLSPFRNHYDKETFACKLTFPSNATEKTEGSVGTKTTWKTLSASKTIIVQPKFLLGSASTIVANGKRCQPPAFTVFNIADARQHLTPTDTVVKTKIVVFEKDKE